MSEGDGPEHPLAAARETARVERQAAREAWEEARKDILALHETWMAAEEHDRTATRSMIADTIGILDKLSLAIRPTITRISQ
jgi:hypothetical protein